MAPEGNTGRSEAADGRRLRLSHPRRFRLARLAMVLVLLFAAAVYAGVAHADDAAVVLDNTTAATPSDTSTTTDPATDSTVTDPSTDPSSSTTDPNGTTTDPTTTEPPADTTGTDPTTPPPGDTAPPPEPVGSGDPTGGSDGGTPVATEPPPPIETPPPIDPVPPVADDPSALPPADGSPEHQPPAMPAFPSGGAQAASLPGIVPAAAPLSLDLLRIGGAPSTKGRDPRLSDNGTRSTKEQSARRSFPPEGSPASSPSSAASGASGASGSGGGVALAVEFLLAALLVLRYTRKASFILPDSLAFALREERPG